MDVRSGSQIGFGRYRKKVDRKCWMGKKGVYVEVMQGSEGTIGWVRERSKHSNVWEAKLQRTLACLLLLTYAESVAFG